MENMKTILITGLGNPSKKYARTRHNAGFMFVDYFRDQNCENFSDWEENKKLKSEISIGKFDSNKIILLKPQTFMNLSGQAVSTARKYYKIKLGDTFIVQDEIDLPLGTYKFSANRSSAGHKGVQSIINALGTKNFTRLRIGVDNRTSKKIPTEKYVLGKFADTELVVLRKIFEESAEKLQEKIK
jgi:PTH1 family peptidyl-tRNA hydrolase